MNHDKVRAVARRYAELLRDRGSKPIRESERGPAESDPALFRPKLARYDHLLWMCEQILTDPEFSEGKAKRWLGFVQGAFWVLCFRTVNQMKDDNRPDPWEPPA